MYTDLRLTEQMLVIHFAIDTQIINQNVQI